MWWIYITAIVVSVLKVHGEELTNEDISDIQVKLSGGRTEREGNVDICIAGRCGIFCYNGFGHVHAEVICRMIGYQRGHAVRDGPFAEGNNTSYWWIKAICNGAEDTLSNCNLITQRYSRRCRFNAGVICGEPDIQVKLIGGLTEREGNVDIFIAGKWGMCCVHNFDHVHAEVICRMLGYQRGVALVDGPFSEGNNTSYWLIKARCNGAEDTLSNCKLREVGYSSSCDFNTGVICGEPDIQVKLIGGRTEREGNVDIFIAGRWGMFCDNDFDNADAEVICRMLGYQRGIAVGNGPFADGNNTSYWWTDARCNGAEATLSDCILIAWWYSWYSSLCSFKAGVICGEPDIQVKLIGGRTEREGNVDIFIAGRWWMFCDNGFDNADAEVICRMLGYQRGIAVGNGPFADGNNTSYWRIDARCNGAEATLSDCILIALWYSSLCSFKAGVICGEPDIQVKLIGGRTEREGNVDIFIAGRWRMFCDNGFDNADAEVICRMLGYQRALAVHDGPFAEGNNTSYWLIKARCNGAEDTLSNCKLREVGYSSSCDFNAGVICDEPDTLTTEMTSPNNATQVRLVDGNTIFEGRVEVFHFGEWGTVCDDDWDNNDAEVICRMLNYSGGNAYGNARFGTGYGSILMDDVSCRGNETDIADCIHSGWEIENCNHNEDAGVSCNVSNLGIQVKLIGGRTNREGNIFIDIAGSWGMLCDNDYDHVQAVGICRMLGYQRGIVITNGPFIERRNSKDNWQIISRCNGTEATISNCKLHVLRQPSSCIKNAGVICGEPDIQVRLVGGQKKHDEGNIDILIAGEWGSFCPDSFEHDEVDVICRMLGHQRGIAITNGPFLARRDIIYSWGIISRCNGTEATISDCKLIVWRQSCEDNAGVICGEPDIQVKLIGGRTEREGAIDMCIAGRWGMICGNDFDNIHAEVICHMLGYQRGIVITNGPFFDDERNTISNWEINSTCNGTEATLSNCKLKLWWKQSPCQHYAGVICDEPASPSDIRLVGGNYENEGRIEININGRWGTICAELFDSKDAIVLCRFLSQPQSLVFVVNNEHFGKGNTTMGWKIKPNCYGNETSLSECQIDVFSTNTECSEPQAGVICGNEPDIRLVGGNYENEGRIEININGRWGTICAELFDRKDAKVLCRFLSQPQSLVFVVNNEHFGKGNTSMEWKIQFNCHGNETSLSECPIGVISSNFKCFQPQAGLVCGNEPEVPEKNQSGDHGIELSEVTGGLLGVVSVAVLAFGVFIYCRRLRRVQETSVTDAQTIQEPRPRPRPRPRRISSSYDEIDDVNVLVNDYDTIGNPDAVYLELIDHYDQLESPDELSIADPNDGYLHPNVHGTGGEVTESGDGDEDNHPNDGYLHPIVHGTGGESCEMTGSDRDEDNHPNDGYLQPIVDGTGGEVTESGDGDEDSPPNDGYLQPIVHGTGDKSGEETGSGDADEDSPPNDVCSNDDGLVEMDIE